MRKKVFIYALIFGLIWLQVTAQSDIQSTSNDFQVTLSALVEPRQVPLNRTLTFTVKIVWQGDLYLIALDEIEEPVLSNFDIVGTASSNKITGTAEGRKSTKEILYTLMPRTLGMGYIEPVRLTYTDKSTEKSHAMMTQRIGVEVLSPVAEPGEVQIPWLPILIGFGIVLAVIVFILFKRKRTAAEDEEAIDVIEEAYLGELKNQADLKDPGRQNTLSFITKLIRRYLAEKYKISALEATTNDLLKLITEHDVEESLVRKCETLFKKTDVIQFSGSEVLQSELDEAYTMVETILEKQLAQANEALRLKEVDKSKKRKKK